MKRAEPGDLVSRLNGKPLVIMLDIDGTLCEIVEQPGEARIPGETTETLRALSLQEPAGFRLVFVTGRSVADAERMLNLAGVVIFGNHGIERKSATGNIRKPEGWEEQQQLLDGAAQELSALVDKYPGVTLEDKRFSLSLHYRNLDPARVPELSARVRDIVGRRALRLVGGKCVFNVLPNGAPNKGDAVREVLRELHGSSGASILFVGDDVTDEDAFEALTGVANAVTVRVGDADRESAAMFALDTPRDVHELLSQLAGRAKVRA